MTPTPEEVRALLAQAFKAAAADSRLMDGTSLMSNSDQDAVDEFAAWCNPAIIRALCESWLAREQPQPGSDEGLLQITVCKHGRDRTITGCKICDDARNEAIAALTAELAMREDKYITALMRAEKAEAERDALLRCVKAADVLAKHIRINIDPDTDVGEWEAEWLADYDAARAARGGT